MAQKQKVPAAIGVTIAVLLVIVVSSIGYYQYIYAPAYLTSTTSTTSTVAGKLVQINITVGASTKTDDAYQPNPVKLVIGVNNTVAFYNGDTASGGVPHTATDKGGKFDTGVIQAGATSSPIQIKDAGTYNYYCVIHPTTMRGTIVVLQAQGGSPATTSSATSASSSVVSTSTSTATSTSSSTTTSARTTTSSQLTTSSSSVSRVGVSIPKGSGINPSSPGYLPTNIVVVIGVNNTVTWTNNDDVIHTVTARNGAFDSKTMNAGATFTYTFTSTGTFEYYCVYHPWMTGTVVVVK